MSDEKSISIDDPERGDWQKTENEDGSRLELGMGRAQYTSEVDPEIQKSPYYPVLHALLQAELRQLPLSIAGATALEKSIAEKLRAGDPEKGHEPLSNEQIGERVMELAAQMWARQALERCEFTTLPNAKGDEATVAFTAVVLHPNDFGQLMTNIESIAIKLIEKLMAEVAEVPYGFNPGQTPPPALN